jgi:probable phosphoglycerate mutase
LETRVIHYPDLYILRHGETEWNREGVLQGMHDSPLTAKGHEQAAHQGKILDRVISDWSLVDIYSSPQGRAKKTAEIALAGMNRTADLHEALREVDTGDWAGLHISDIIDDDPRMAKPYTVEWLSAYFSSPNGEGYEVFKTRLLEFLTTLNKPTVIITHGMVGFVLRGLYLGLSFEQLAVQVGGQGVVFHLSNGREIVLRD